ncbi:tRNA (adenosine(37)-N6)-threonylcarbamoyltransferase complex ATPase subunit type 1 TsaE [Stratiformator vulcanicus]|uniref:tRNA threonylcarbamoyladenosine biosynthesis protein TsaE n=1 Tax=Stratiformator vulcanicus TaxID=2527980 RepID=A0A517R288_9PLAN|nr:tRNA (adenosine(37)-N6)-threonylcarbamoyltransferase complex ATPase subunit type 1 TsaE [Stratiformator vulcanicus]QDT37978.1 tRNA threonylcarbamoyladenosine biosynthesis protein TsaE [Stratiformator vulcanicus]
MKTWDFEATSVDETARFGTAIADSIRGGDVIGLRGDLGAGKTTLVSSVAVALGVQRHEISSPTFVLLKEYAGRIPIYHFDAYRLGDPDEFTALGADELLADEGLCLIEWVDRVASLLPADRLTIDAITTGVDSRRFRLQSGGTRSTELLTSIAIHCKD